MQRYTKTANDSRPRHDRRGGILERSATCASSSGPRRRRRASSSSARDLPGCPRIPATIDHRVETPRRTTLRCGEAGVEMIEHIMAALAGLQIDNCELWVDRPEMPGCDGSCLPFVEASCRGRRRAERPAAAAGRSAARFTWATRELDRGPALLLGQDGPPLRTRLRQRQPDRPAVAGSLPFAPPFPHQPGPQPHASCSKSEAEAIKARGLGQRATCKDLLVFGPRGPIENQLRFPDECVRHKMVDMVGDLALAGCDLVGPVRRLPQRPPAQRRTGPGDRCRRKRPQKPTEMLCLTET